jgi:hypothetical protein
MTSVWAGSWPLCTAQLATRLSRALHRDVDVLSLEHVRERGPCCSTRSRETVAPSLTATGPGRP